MKSIFKHTKAALFALLAMLISIIMVFGLVACNDTPNNGDDEGGNENTTVITKYDATFDANVVMGPAGAISFGDVLSGTYITKENGNYTLTLIFKLGEIEVYGAKGQIFIDDAPAKPQTVDGLKDGTIGYYKSNGELVTDGVALTYSSGDNYGQTPEKKNVYYVQSAAFSVDSLRDTYELTLFVNSMMKGMQLSKDTYKAAVKLDLSSGEVVNAITGLGVATRGEAPQPVKYTKYGATLDGKVAMGQQEINFTENLLDGAYVIKKGEKHEITLIFKTGEVSIYGNKMTAFLTTAETEGYGGTVTPVYGYYNGETLVTEGITLTYSDGENYVTNKNGSYYYVQSMTFAVDELEGSYDLSIYVLAGNENSVSGMQFPYTLSSGGVSKAILTLDLTDTETVDSIDNLLGVDTLGEVPTQPVQPVESKYTKYDATLDGKVAMGQQEINFTENLLSGAYVIKKSDKYEITLIFKTGEVSIYGNKMTAFLTTAETEGYGGTVTPVYGYYNGETLVTEGIKLTYSNGENYVTNKNGSYYYVQSMTFTVNELEDSYNLSIYVLAGNDNSVSGMQFPYTKSNGDVCNAVLSLDLTDAETVESIDDLLGVDTLGEVSNAKEYQVPIASLTSNAPLAPVQEAFAKAFGDYVTLIVEKDGSMRIRVQNQHMIIDMSSYNWGKHDANVALVYGATVISTKEEVFSDVSVGGIMNPTQETITVPDVFEIAYSPDCNGVIELTVSIDFMAKFSSKEIEEYSTVITLTLDLSSLNLEELN